MAFVAFPVSSSDAGARWQGKDGRLQLDGWSRHRRIVILRRRTERSLALTERDGDGQLRLGFAEIDDGREVWEYAVLVTSLDSEILSLGQLYRDRADCENSFDELKNQWGWFLEVPESLRFPVRGPTRVRALSLTITIRTERSQGGALTRTSCSTASCALRAAPSRRSMLPARTPLTHTTAPSSPA
jgi:hypothetical protein